MKVGILALQGDFAAHARALAECGVATCEVRRFEHLQDVDGLVLPGGESTTMLKLMEGSRLRERLVSLADSGVPILATCAGVILVAHEVLSPRQDSLGILDVTVERNAYGRQLESVVTDISVSVPSQLGVNSIEGVFIRAPRITRYGSLVEVLATRGSDPVLVLQANILAATFHPELSLNSPVFALFCGMLARRRS